MSRRSEPWNDIETLLDLVRVEEETLLAVMEALGELYDSEGEEDFVWDDFPLGECPGDDFPLGERPWGDSPMNVIHH